MNATPQKYDAAIVVLESTAGTWPWARLAWQVVQAAWWLAVAVAMACTFGKGW